MVKSMRLIPTNKVGQACERVRLPRLPCQACYDQERGQSKVENDTVTLNEEKGGFRTVQGGAEGTEKRVLAYDMMSLMTSSHDELWRAMLLSSLWTSRPRRIGWLHGEVDALDFWLAKKSDCCDCWGSHVKRVLTDTGGVWRAERRCWTRLTLSRT